MTSYNFKSYGSKGKIRTNYQLLTLLNDHLQNINAFCFYLGVDYNKMPQISEFSFSPVIEVLLDGKFTDRDVVKLARHGITSNYNSGEDDEQVFIEYISPCPFTCD